MALSKGEGNYILGTHAVVVTTFQVVHFPNDINPNLEFDTPEEMYEQYFVLYGTHHEHDPNKPVEPQPEPKRNIQ